MTDDLRAKTSRWCCVWWRTRSAGDGRRLWSWWKPATTRDCCAGKTPAGCGSRRRLTDWRRPSSGWDWLVGRSSGRRCTRKCAGTFCLGRSRAGNCTTRSPTPRSWKCSPGRAACTAHAVSVRERSFFFFFLEKKFHRHSNKQQL